VLTAVNDSLVNDSLVNDSLINDDEELDYITTVFTAKAQVLRYVHLCKIEKIIIEKLTARDSLTKKLAR
jgi:hypothetical protein